MDKNYAFV